MQYIIIHRFFAEILKTWQPNGEQMYNSIIGEMEMFYRSGNDLRDSAK